MDYKEKIDKIKALAEAAGARIFMNEPLSNHTTVRVGGNCDMMIFAPDAESAARLYFACKEADLYSMILGNGSNCLFCDEGFRGAVIVPTSDREEIKVSGNVIEAPAGAQLIKVCKAAWEAGLSGLEFAYGIPGTVGGAVYMNAGAYGGEIKRAVSSVRAMQSDGKAVDFTANDLDFGYRRSRFEHSGEVILSARFELTSGNRKEIGEKMTEIIQSRRQRQPLEYPSFGSAFKRPAGTFAGLVIERSGLRGRRLGDAQISQKHANFIINLGKATAADIMELIATAQSEVKEKTGYMLEPEVKLIPAQR